MFKRKNFGYILLHGSSIDDGGYDRSHMETNLFCLRGNISLGWEG